MLFLDKGHAIRVDHEKLRLALSAYLCSAENEVGVCEA